MEKPIPQFPFRLADAKAGEPILIGPDVYNFVSTEKIGVYGQIRTFDKFENAGKQGRYIEDGHAVYMYSARFDDPYLINPTLSMLNPDSKTIPVGAREKFESGVCFTYKGLGLLKLQCIDKEKLFRDGNRVYCDVEEIRDWGFLLMRRLLDDKIYKWVQFKDIKFVD